MSVPKNNLAEQMAALTKRNESLKNLLKRKRNSEPISSDSKRPFHSFSNDNRLSSSSLPTTPAGKTPSSTSLSCGIFSPEANTSAESISPIKISEDVKKKLPNRVQSKLGSFLNKTKKPPDSAHIIEINSDGEDENIPKISEFDKEDDDADFIQTKPKNKVTNRVLHSSSDDKFPGQAEIRKQDPVVSWDTRDPPEQKPVIQSELNITCTTKMDKTSPLTSPNLGGVKFETTDYSTKSVKSEKSFNETVAEFNLLDSTMMMTSTRIPEETTPVPSRSVLSSPEKGSGILVKVQPSKGIKLNVEQSPVSSPFNGEDYLRVCEEICAIVHDAGNGTLPFSAAVTSKLQSLQNQRLQLSKSRYDIPGRDLSKTSDMIFERNHTPDRYDDFPSPKMETEEEEVESGNDYDQVDFLVDDPDNQDEEELRDEEDLFSDNDIDEEFLSRLDEDLVVSQQTPTTSSSHHHDSDASFTATQLTHNTKISDHEELARTDFPFSKRLLQGFKQVFGLHKFRKNQLECMNATLLGQDCFVLMPTGGGKSLCYQLPALLRDGVTVVVSPLKSLIQDQVQKLVELGVPASHLSGALDANISLGIFKDLNSREPQLKLLYVTPEKIGASNKLKDCFTSLYKRGLLARFVIDEAHCVSQWGHDFRPDYTKLHTLRDNYREVPIMALTATAAPRVRADVLHNLGLKDAKVFIASFNRANLKYIQVSKSRKTDYEGVVSLIESKYKGKCGIVYCFSRNDCEECAQFLLSRNIAAEAYHAGLSDSLRSKTQTRWIDDQVQVVCATIAFGMGIDKHDVRFVIHHTLPKSVEGFYQESGRAGRDGDPADCILMYNYSDVGRLKNIIMTGAGGGSTSSTQTHLDNLNYMIQYCENRVDCRRTQLLSYFGETFASEKCNKTCDNCLARGKYQIKDLTREAGIAVNLVREITRSGGGKFTLLHCIDVLRGLDNKKIRAARHNQAAGFGKLRSATKSTVERLMRRLVTEGVLQERIEVGFHGSVISYLYTGRKCDTFLRGGVKFTMDVEVATRNKDVVAEDKSSSAVDTIVKLCYDQLLACRKKLAAEKGVSVHNIVPNETLHEMSRVRPQTVQQLLSITGITQLKVDFYGTAFLHVLQSFPSPCKADTSSSKWISAGSGKGSSKPRTNTGAGRKKKSVPIKTATPAPSSNVSSSDSNVRLMPLPVPKKPGSFHRRL